MSAGLISKIYIPNKKRKHKFTYIYEKVRVGKIYDTEVASNEKC